MPLPEGYTDIARRRWAVGNCTYCGLRPPRPGKRFCQNCADIANERYHAARDKRRAAGKCIECGVNPPGKKTATCDDCLRIKAVYRDMRRKKQANGTAD